ncbi:hypothetical protein HSX37_17130|uniref:Uncharacterized protein n=1 Tax=Dendrosporobacter quercicolus TaxID=146817 RepID=A0A1G9KFQ5_9FIRM|nr:hypothetical protein [Dendrosporobacter quercicolus]NSL49751.1 hypothetical protein [Dendrosporobacter quercicolus DSM 1736]SDL48511.1 hypothetical protein SAMN04488502_10121 [Dendrosporobacter quercicolus]
MILDKVIEDIKKLEVTGNFINNVMYAFENYKFGGEIEVTIIKDSETSYQVNVKANADRHTIKINTKHEKTTAVQERRQ